MTAVVDASTLVASLVDPGPEGTWAEQAMANNDIAGPELVLAEASNTLRRLERAGDLSTAVANVAQRILVRTDIQLYRFAPVADRVWALRNNLTSYDAWYVAIAESLDCPLLTLDRRLVRATGPRCQILTAPDRTDAPT